MASGNGTEDPDTANYADNAHRSDGAAGTFSTNSAGRPEIAGVKDNVDLNGTTERKGLSILLAQIAYTFRTA